MDPQDSRASEHLQQTIRAIVGKVEVVQWGNGGAQSRIHQALALGWLAFLCSSTALYFLRVRDRRMESAEPPPWITSR
jgi:hypothetical protein